MKVASLSLLLAALAQADTIQLNAGKPVTGRVIALQNGNLDFVTEAGKTNRVPAASLVAIDFVNGEAQATLELLDKTKLTGNLLLFARGHFSFVKADGETIRVPLAQAKAALFGPPPPPPPAAVPVAATGKVKVISHGEKVDYQKHFVPGKVVVVDFFAEWCGPCRAIAPILDRYAKTDADIVVLQIDIREWGSPVAEQYGVKGVPMLRVFDRKGKLAGEMSGFGEKKFQEFLAKAKAS